MTDEEIYQQIEEYREEADALYEKIHEQVEASIVKHAQAKKKRKKLFVSLLSVAVALIVTLGIVLPITLQPQDEEIRYGSDNTLVSEVLDINLKEYYEANNLSLLYLDWYEYAEDLSTVRYYEEGKESSTVYLYEKFTDGNTGCGVEISVMRRNIVVDRLEEQFEEYEFTDTSNIQITYALNRDWSIAKFEYHGYKYYLKIIEEGLTLQALVEIIESMFNN